MSFEDFTGVDERTRMILGMTTQNQPMMSGKQPKGPIGRFFKNYMPVIVTFLGVAVLLLAIYVFGAGGASEWRRGVIHSDKNGRRWYHFISSSETVAVKTKFGSSRRRRRLSTVFQNGQQHHHHPHPAHNHSTRPDGYYPFENNYAWEAEYEMDYKMLSTSEQKEFCYNFTKYQLAYQLTPHNHTHFNYFHFHTHMHPHHHHFLTSLWNWHHHHHSHHAPVTVTHLHKKWSLYPVLVQFCHNHTEHHWNLEWNKRKTQISPLLFATMESLFGQWQGNTGLSLNITCDSIVLSNGTVVSCGKFKKVFDATCNGFDFKMPVSVNGLNIIDTLKLFAQTLNITLPI